MPFLIAYVIGHAVIATGAITLAALLWLVPWHRPGIPWPRVWWWFGATFAVIAVDQLLDVLELWVDAPWGQLVGHYLLAATMGATAFALARTVPTMLRYRPAHELEEINRRLNDALLELGHPDLTGERARKLHAVVAELRSLSEKVRGS